MAQEFLIQGRIVFGHPTKPRIKKDVRTRQPVIKDGQQVHQYVFGVAIEKNTFVQQVWPFLAREAQSAFPNGIPNNFSYKYKDGDGVDSKGQPYNKREGYAGHCVLSISTEGFAPTVYKHENGSYRQLAENEIKCGDFVAVKITCKYNGAVSPNTPGLYINPNGVVLLGYGQEISSAGQDPDEMFAGMQPQQFAGMSHQPLMSAAPLPSTMVTGQPPQQFQSPVHAVPVGVTGQPQYVAPPAGGTMPPPHNQFVQNAMGQPPVQGAPVQQFQPPVQGGVPNFPGMPPAR